MVSDNAFFGSADLTDFYLGTPVTLPLSQRQFIRIDVDSYSPAVLALLSLLTFIRTARNGKRFVIFRIDQTMHGLKDAGKLSNLRLVASGFLETTTPCLFRHVSRPISFVLVVDDFALNTKIATTMTISFLAFLAPVYGSSASQHATTDSSPPATTAQKKELEIAIGYLLYYGRCVDGRVLTTTGALASAQTTATLATMADLDRLLDFVSAHPNGMKIFRPSTVTLDVLTDASYLSRPNAGSVAGSFHHLASCNDPTFFNAPISVHSTRIPVVCSSVQEAEYWGSFAAAKIADLERQVLSDFGYLQPPTTIDCDNKVAVDLANRTIKPKMSKSCDMRCHCHWLQDRVQRCQLRVQHVPGVWNVADFFTKSLPVVRHKILAPFIALDPSTAHLRP